MRIIGRLDIKNEFVIKGIHLEGLRKVGNPNELAKKYYDDGVDELVFIDSVASLYNRNNIFSVIQKASEEVFVPITIGGGLRSLDDIKFALDSGADKVALNTAIVKNPNLIESIAKQYGSQCIVGSVQAKENNDQWEAYIETGREKTGINVLDWVVRLQNMGVGEILLTSVDKEGTKKGFDINLIKEVSKIIKIPLIISGGFGKKEDFKNLFMHAKPSGICFASVLHYNVMTIREIKSAINEYYQK